METKCNCAEQMNPLVEALRHAEKFIENGIELGVIRMPDKETPDPAHDTLPMIKQALATIEQQEKHHA